MASHPSACLYQSRTFFGISFAAAYLVKLQRNKLIKKVNLFVTGQNFYSPGLLVLAQLTPAKKRI